MIEQSIKHNEYFYWLKNQLNNWLYNPSLRVNESVKFSKVTGTYNKSLCFKTTCHPVFFEFYNGFYINKKKFVNFDILEKYFTELSLAIWVMDDGGLTGKRKRNRLCTNGFTKSEVDKLSLFLFNKYQLKTWVAQARTKKRLTWELHFDKASSLKLSSLIKHLVVPSMQYKLL